MVDMCMRQKNGTNFGGIKGKDFIIQLSNALCPLEHTAIHQKAVISDLQEITGACNHMRCANKFKPHDERSFLIIE